MAADTIVAAATPPGRGGVAIIRLSGNHAYQIALKLTTKNQINPRKAYFCSFYNEKKELIDNGIVLYFRKPQSFTGEDVVELQVHGSPIIVDYLLQLCVIYGAVLAKPGEFSERAFINDKMDLTQAEAVADLIEASSLSAARMAVRSLQGDFSKQITILSDKIINLRIFIEAALDFPEEEIDFLSDGKITTMLNDALGLSTTIRASASQGVMMREGLSIVIAGKPNAGKSTLINYLAGREIAIVTPWAGTTRDVVREQLLIDDLPIQLIDTAGLREDSEDLIEQEGIRRTWQQISIADCLLLIIDINHCSDEVELINSVVAKLAVGVPIIRVFNKMDTLSAPITQKSDDVYISAKSGEGVELLKAKIKAIAGFQPAEGQFLARRRHLQALDKTQEYLQNCQAQLSINQAGEMAAEDLRLAQQALGEITGELSSDDLLGKIFSSFCIGK